MYWIMIEAEFDGCIYDGFIQVLGCLGRKCGSQISYRQGSRSRPGSISLPNLLDHRHHQIIKSIKTMRIRLFIDCCYCAPVGTNNTCSS